MLRARDDAAAAPRQPKPSKRAEPPRAARQARAELQGDAGAAGDCRRDRGAGAGAGGAEPALADPELYRSDPQAVKAANCAMPRSRSCCCNCLRGGRSWRARQRDRRRPAEVDGRRVQTIYFAVRERPVARRRSGETSISEKRVARGCWCSRSRLPAVAAELRLRRAPDARQAACAHRCHLHRSVSRRLPDALCRPVSSGQAIDGSVGGFRYLIGAGSWFVNARYAHFPTFTCVGHAAMMTGAHPYVSGIVSNRWWDRARTEVYCVDDERYRVWVPPRQPGQAHGTAASAQHHGRRRAEARYQRRGEGRDARAQGPRGDPDGRACAGPQHLVRRWGWALDQQHAYARDGKLPAGWRR